ncbi:molybdopterin-binding protein [Methanorbis rubei]|uniref:MoaB/Mog domain-containing protein n=1 Tax=Methanorbis rubei TaxID=3028300 RepID=A0AAE4MGJ4_9EURY|nr:hypothetical protein [Methanocorpusculaceae archaeon Cs1]
MAMKRYLHQITVNEAVEVIKSIPPHTTIRRVPVIESVGHKLAQSIYAEYSVPEVPVSAMDGFAVKSSQTVKAGDQTPLTLKNFAQVNTGNVIPKEFDAVIRVEDVWFEGSSEAITIRKSVNPGTNVRAAGEDIRAGQLILPAGTIIRPFDVGAIASYGITHVSVRSVSVGILPTGTELIMPGERPAPGQVVESNTTMAEAYLRQFGVGVIRYPPVVDNPVLIRGALEKILAENDIAIVSAGSSAGTKDFTAKVIAELGELLFHGVAVKPAKPAMFGLVGKKPVFGLPGYPLSAQTVLRLFVGELLESWGWKRPRHAYINVRLGDSISSEGGIDEFSLHAAARIGSDYAAIPQSRGASVQMTGVRSNIVIQIPNGIEGFEAGEIVPALLAVPIEELDRTVLIAGVYDASIEALTELAVKKDIRIRTGNFNGLSGLMLLMKNACHLVCITDSSDLAVLGDLPIVQHKITKNAVLVCRKEMENDPLTKTVLELADSAEFRKKLSRS